MEKGKLAGCIIRATTKAQGGGANVEKLDEALAAGRETMRAKIFSFADTMFKKRICV
jgi:hypothetical protein